MAYMIRHGRSYDTEMLRSFDSMAHRVFGAAGIDLSPFPAVDVRDENDRYVIEVELPGFTENDVDIQVKEGVLSVASIDVSEDEDNQDSANGRRRRREFNRRFSLPKDVNREEIEAAFTNGLLIITLSKQPEAQPRKIEIQVN
ncbi:MAG: Hsp20/alpha crystallin family protein [Spirochaetia bacterium]